MNDFFNNLTIVFSSYNIKDTLIEAIGSFLKLYTSLKDHIVVFEDESTDGTLEWLQENNIRTITWSKDIREFIKKYGKMSPTFYCNMIANECMRQIDTKYIFLSDGDVIFYNPFLEKYAQLIKDYKVVGFMLHDELTKDLKNAAECDKIDLCVLDGYYYRIWQGHLLLDLEYLKEKKINYDSLDFNYYINNREIDSGAYFLIELMKNNIPYYELTVYNKLGHKSNLYNEENNIFKHIGGAACSQKW